MPRRTDELDRSRAVRDVDLYLRLAEMLGRPLRPSGRVLDFGCGHGTTVLAFRRRGLAAYGVDVTPHWARCGDVREKLAHRRESEPIFSRIDRRDCRFPHADDSFDFVFSNMVLEHAQNYGQAFAEISRVLRPDGFSLHVFPARNLLVEPHIRVPLATRIQNYAYLRLWAGLGIRNAYQKGFSARHTALINLVFLRTRTTYYSMREIRRLAAPHFEEVTVASADYGRCTHTRKRHLYRLLRLLPAGNTLGNTFFERVILLQGPQRVGDVASAAA